MIYLETVQFGKPVAKVREQFPFTVPAIASLIGKSLHFKSDVCFLVGENGSGKSTVLEALAATIGSVAVGAQPLEKDKTLAHIRPLVSTIRASWTRRTKRGFFMRSEDFFGYAQHMQHVREELEEERRQIVEDPNISAVAKGFYTMPYSREIGDMQRRYGAGLDSQSHGESFLKLFQNRFVPDGLYLMDEPEAPLSPMRQLALLALLRDCVEQKGAQFIIATHSPILMAFPGATIYTFDDGRVSQIQYEDTEHYRFTRDFLNNPDSFLRHL